MKSVWCIPSNVETNKYMTLMQTAMRQAGYKVFGRGQKMKKIGCDIVHLNWFENISDQRFPKIAYLKKVIFLCSMKLLGKKIVFTMHNKMPHDHRKNRLSDRLMKKMVRLSDGIIIHSKYSLEIIHDMFKNVDPDKIYYVPLPNYESAYRDRKKYARINKGKDDLLLAFVGQIRPYKNVDILIEAANRLSGEKNIKFLICGQCISDEYKRQLTKLKKNADIIMDTRFIDDDEIPSLINSIDILILPYNTESALNSAAAMLAFTYGKTVISTEVGTILDLEYTGNLYTYQYSDEHDIHVNNLYEGILTVYKVFTSDPQKIKLQGEAMKELVHSENSLKAVSEAIEKAYLKILKGKK